MFDNLKFRKTITIAEKARLVLTIADSIFMDDEYLPEVFEEQFWMHIALAYAENEDFNDQFSADDFMDAFYNGGLQDRIKESVNMSQVDAIRDAVQRRADAILSKTPADDFFLRAMSLLQKIEDAVVGIDLKEAINSLGNLDVVAEIGKVLAENQSERLAKENMKED